ncbi:MAG: hypothetical protein RSA29_10535 [Clostridium sp.]|uniref:hypothetical protein n=1 Tax=Clostridium sp. TaxID=1506 RepID=UPI002FC879E4
MAYTKTVWKDRIVEKPRTYDVTNNLDGSITLTPKSGLITEEGTPISASNMNNIEDGITKASVIEDTVTKEKYRWGIENGSVFLEKVVE